VEGGKKGENIENDALRPVNLMENSDLRERTKQFALPPSDFIRGLYAD
jgi:hypothetical protein